MSKMWTSKAMLAAMAEFDGKAEDVLLLAIVKKEFEKFLFYAPQTRRTIEILNRHRDAAE